MKKIKEYKVIIIIVLVLILGVFYWYEWRPSQIQKDCLVKVKKSIEGKDIPVIDVQRFLDICIKGNGLK